MKNMPKNMPLIAGGVVVLFLVVGGIFAATQMTGEKVAEVAEETSTKKKKKVGVPDNVIDVSERPYIKLEPLADGRNIMIEADTIKKPAETMEYELEYQAGSLLQGAFGAIDLTGSDLSAKILFGSCSAGGACTYHEDVKGGSLRAILSGTEEYALRSDWNYIINSARSDEHMSSDEKFTITADNLARQSYVIIYNTPGYPEGLEGTPVSDPFQIGTVSALSGTATVTIEAMEAPSSIMGWDGSSWQTLEGSVDGNTITAEGDLMELYVAVQ